MTKSQLKITSLNTEDTRIAPDFSPRFRQISKLLELKNEDVFEKMEYYNENMKIYDNTIYEDVETRFAHLDNFLQQNWFAKRLNRLGPVFRHYDTFIDLGFSLPYPYFFPDFCAASDINCIFVDKESSAKRFYDALVEAHNLEWRRDIDDVILMDIERQADHDQLLSIIRTLKAKRIFVCCSEVIEHLAKPEMAWRLLESISRLIAPGQTTAYLTLPIGDRIPSHTLEFGTPEEAISFVEPHLSNMVSNFVPSTDAMPAAYAKGYCSFEGQINSKQFD